MVWHANAGCVADPKDWERMPCAGCAFLPEAEEFSAAIDGTDGRSWHLPLEPLTSSSLEAYSLRANT